MRRVAKRESRDPVGVVADDPQTRPIARGVGYVADVRRIEVRGRRAEERGGGRILIVEVELEVIREER